MNTIEITRFKTLSYACTEAMNTLCTNLTFAGKDKKVIMVTSAQAHEGKSFVTMNIMRTLAGLGHKVVLVDADLRRSQITSKYGLKIKEGQGMGLTHYLAGMCSTETVLYTTDMPNASIVPLGHEVSNSLALLSTGRMAKLLTYLRERFDLTCDHICRVVKELKA
jgi:capsular exopolysaccharide synthesis family protein